MQQFHSLTIMIKVSDIRKAIAFYSAMGFDLIETDEFHYGEGNINWALMKNGGASIMLNVNGDDTPKTSQEFFLRVDDADAFYAAIKDKVTITKEPQDQFYGMRDFWFSDPFGYQWGAGHPLEASGGDGVTG